MGKTLSGTNSLSAALAVAATAIIVSGCTTSRIGGLNTQPAPLNPAPSGTVSSSQLPPPSRPETTQAPTVDPNGFPEAPGGTQLAGTLDEPALDGTTAAQDSSVQQVASTAPVTRETMVGAWSVSTGGANCQMFMALTRWSTGYRAASRGCPGDAANVSSWDVDGNQVVLSDANGNRVATLFSSGGSQFNGQTSGGQAISLSR